MVDSSSVYSTNQSVEVVERSRELSKLSGRETLVNDPSREKLQEFEVRRSDHGRVPRRRFEIEGEPFMVALQDDLWPKSVQEILSCPNLT